MCLTSSPIRNASQWNWDGQTIIQDAVVPSSRPTVGPGQKEYDIDVREFLVTDRNAVMRKTLEHDVRRFINCQHGGDWSLFKSRKEKSYDYRVAMIRAWVAENIAYSNGPVDDPWQFPDETLALKSGDCEDRALLLASLMLASGVSSFNVRVALGQMRLLYGTEVKVRDHVWAMYKTERGEWQIVEPLLMRKHNYVKVRLKKNDLREIPQSVEYVPSYVFNDVHLWAIGKPAMKFQDMLTLRKNWKMIHPKFGGAMHWTIMHEALNPDPDNWPNLRGTMHTLGGDSQWVLDAIEDNFHRVVPVVGPRIDLPDDWRYQPDYNPYDHFDNAYIKESWDLAQNRLKQFQADNKNIQSFALAAHGIADFYAHTSYMHYAPKRFPKDLDGSADTWNGTVSDARYLYDQGHKFDLDNGGFTRNTSLVGGIRKNPSQVYNGQLISGRYAQSDSDVWPGVINEYVEEGKCHISQELKNAQDFYLRGLLPHHAEIAVDDETGSSKLYTSNVFQYQSRWRKNTAILHINHEFFSRWQGGSKPL